MTELAKAEAHEVAPYRKYTPEQIIDALEHSRGLIAPAARYLQCSRDTIRDYIKRYPEIARAKKDADEVVNDIAENSLFNALERGEAWAICFRLKTKAKDRGYIEKAEISGAGGGPVKIQLVYDA
jgi:hypothetical protein